MKEGEIYKTGNMMTGHRYWVLDKVNPEGLSNFTELRWADMSKPGCMVRTSTVMRRKIHEWGAQLRPGWLFRPIDEHDKITIISTP